FLSDSSFLAFSRKTKRDESHFDLLSIWNLHFSNKNDFGEIKLLHFSWTRPDSILITQSPDKVKSTHW
ncbi:MAG: hypothetical protein ACO3UY_07115, partial [Opitutales bacterium]